MGVQQQPQLTFSEDEFWQLEGFQLHE